MNSLKGNLTRKILQVAVLALIIIFSINVFGFIGNVNTEAYCPFGGIQALASYFLNDSLACDMTTIQIAMGILLVAAVFSLGKLFCAYLCPIGYINELLTKLRKLLGFKELVIRDDSISDKILRSFKYILLFVVFYISISSSELFCKQFDPYYAFSTGFQGEINLWMSLIAIYLILIGSFFIKMFWCKYICPLGAINNIFKYLLSVIALLLTYYLSFLFGLKLPWYLLLASFCIIGYLSEIFYKQVKVFPLLKVRRDKNKCMANCEECVKRCPYNIPVNKSDVIKHVDCTMCCDCIAVCKCSALSVNGKKWLHWILPIVVVLLFFAGIFIGNRWEMPTINLKWGNYKTIKTESIEIRGLRSVKCYASSMNFAKKVKNIQGIYGVKAYIQHHRVEILYKPQEITVSDIEKSIYKPVKFKILQPAKEVKSVKIVTIHTQNMTDPIDVNYLGMQFRQGKRKYYGLESEYSKPLTIRIYMDMTEPVDMDYIKKVVEMREMDILLHGGKVKKEKVDFRFINAEDKIDSVSKRALLELFFRPYKKMFKKDIDEKILSIYDVVYPEIEKPIIARGLPVLANYLSLNEGLMGLETTLNLDDEPVIRVYYLKNKISEKEIQSILTQKKWKVKTKNGIIKEMDSRINISL
ncbi:MAG: 4Fe-4S binding protein [Bacteroidales bacterium]